MPLICLQTHIHAPIERCFNLSRSIDLHQLSTSHTGEKAIAGRTSGLINLDETVTWRAKHFWLWQTLTSKITTMQSPRFFADEMVQGAFESFRHEHYFATEDGITIMTDVFNFTSPLGWLGRLANVLFLTRYITKLLEKRNQVIKKFAESENWRQVLP